jgi:hypothetical protein
MHRIYAQRVALALEVAGPTQEECHLSLATPVD